MDIKELIKKAVENLNRVRQLKLSITGILSLSDNDNVFYVSILDNESGCAFDVAVDENMSNQQLLPDDPTNISPDDIIMLRIAKLIFEADKKSKNNIIDNGLTLSSSALNSGQIIGALNSDQIIGALDIDSVSTKYDISVNGRSLTDTIDEVDELKNRIRDLENINSTLICEIDDLKTLLKAKGIL